MEASAFGGVSWRRFVEASAFCESVLVRLTRMAFCGHGVPFRSVLRAFGGGVSRMGFDRYQRTDGRSTKTKDVEPDERRLVDAFRGSVWRRFERRFVDMEHFVRQTVL